MKTPAQFANHLLGQPDGIATLDENKNLVQMPASADASAGAHNATYRGKFLGTSVTSAQYAAINSGTFNDLYIGDYWTIGGVNYRIAAFDYFYNTGDTTCLTHHAVIVPDTVLYRAAVNTTNSTDGGYVGSRMYTTHLAQAKSTIKSAFSNHVLNHREFLINAMTDGKPSDADWYDSEVELMNERMVYGGAVFAPSAGTPMPPMQRTVCKSQLPLFFYRPDLIVAEDFWWLRDPISSIRFALVGLQGYATYNQPSVAYGVRPFFSIC